MVMSAWGGTLLTNQGGAWQKLLKNQRGAWTCDSGRRLQLNRGPDGVEFHVVPRAKYAEKADFVKKLGERMRQWPRLNRGPDGVEFHVLPRAK